PRWRKRRDAPWLKRAASMSISMHRALRDGRGATVATSGEARAARGGTHVVSRRMLRDGGHEIATTSPLRQGIPRSLLATVRTFRIVAPGACTQVGD
ncbi:MAG TPA: hypothetical protein VIV60_26220, partial [Polyangiaceae bacterium]